MFANIDDDKVFCQGDLVYYTYTLASLSAPMANNNKHFTVVENSFTYKTNVNVNGVNMGENTINTGKIQTFLEEIKKKYPDIKFRYKFVNCVRNMCHSYSQGGSNTSLILNDVLQIFTNYNFTINIDRTFYNNKRTHVHIPPGWDYDSNERQRKMRDTVEYEITYFIDNTAPTKLPKWIFDIQYKRLDWPTFPAVKKTLPAVYFDYLLENNQNFQLENKINDTQERLTTLEATTKAQETHIATLEATIKTQEDQKATLEAHAQDLSADLLKLQAHHNTFVTKHAAIFAEMQEKIKKLQQSHVDNETTTALLKNKSG